MSAAPLLQTLGSLESAFARVAAERLGHDLGGGFADRLTPAVLRAAENARERDLGRFLERVNGRDPTAEQAFVEALTVGETYFFRDPKHFDVIRERLVAHREDGRGGRLRLWSAGCATGEEPYSMAVIALEVFGNAASAFVEIVATDVNGDFLRRARVGIYGEWSFRGTPASLRTTWFEPAGPRYRVKSAVRGLVRFGPLNLALPVETEPGPTEVDIVFCRNVLVYFARDGIRTAQTRFASALRLRGELVAGPSDPLLDDPGLAIDLTRGFVTYRRERPAIDRLAEVRPSVRRPPAREHVPTRANAQPKPERARERVRVPKELLPRSDRRTGTTAPDPAAPPTADEEIERAQRLAAVGELDRAVALLGDLIARAPLVGAAYVVRGGLRLAAGDARGALADASKASMLDRGLVFAQVILATANAQLGDHAAVARACRAARKALAAFAPDAPIPFAGGATAGELFAASRDAERAVGPRSGGKR